MLGIRALARSIRSSGPLGPDEHGVQQQPAAAPAVRRPRATDHQAMSARAAATTTTTNGSRSSEPGQAARRRPAVPSPGRRSAAREHLHRHQRGEQHDRAAGRPPGVRRAGQHPLGHRHPGQLEQVAADRAAEHRQPDHEHSPAPVVGPSRRSSPSPSATTVAARTGTPAGDDADQRQRERGAEQGGDPVAAGAQPRPEQAEEGAPDGGVEAVGARVAEGVAGQRADQGGEVPQHEHRQAGREEPGARVLAGSPASPSWPWTRRSAGAAAATRARRASRRSGATCRP